VPGADGGQRGALAVVPLQQRSSPHHPIGAKGIGESATVGSPPAVVNAVIDALEPYGVRHMDMPCTPARVWAAMQGRATPPV
jgi:carbon-monoxide dehydrogenase large subunit